MSISVGVNPPKTPVTEGSQDKAPASIPNVCKMPGPPAPFVPTPLPNIGDSGDRLSEATTTVKIEGKKVAIKGSYYYSKGDMASQGTGGGIISACVHGKTEFTAPGSMDVKAEGKNIQLLGDAMTNNGNKPNTGATVPGNLQAAAAALGVSEHDAQIICQAFCDTQKKYNQGKIKGRGCCSKEFQRQIEASKSPGMRTEQSYWMPNNGPPQLLRPGLFNDLARGLQGSPTFNFVSGLIGSAAGAAGQSVIPSAGVRLSRAMRLMGQGHVCRPDLTIVRGGKTQVFDAKFKWKSGADKLSKQQKKDYKKIGGKKPKVIDGKTCGC